jgi:hypothetical protein
MVLAMTHRIFADLDDEDFVDLRRLAHLDRRTPRDQIRLVLERYVKRSRPRLSRAQPRGLPRPVDALAARRREAQT